MSERRYGIGYSIPNHDDYALLKLGPALDEAARLGVDYVELRSTRWNSSPMGA